MSVAPYPLIPESTPRRRRSSTQRRKSPRNEKLIQPISVSRHQSKKVEQLPTQPAKLPSQLKLMLRLQQASSVLAFGLILTTLGVYAWTVYVPKLWSKEYRDLETLQRHERHLTATNESIKNQLARQAEKPEAGLANPHPAQSIFLPETSVKPITTPESKSNPVPSLTSDSVAY